jgi:tetratricopeptide (TPR) repeat protein
MLLNSFSEVQFNFHRALEFYYQAYEMNEKVLSSEHIYLTKYLNRIINAYNKNGEYEKAMHFCNIKLAEQRLNLPINHPRIGHTLQTLADLYSKKDSTQAFAYYHEALTIFESCTPPDQQATADCLEHISDLYYNLGTYDEALKYRKNALDIQQKYRSSQHPMIALSLQWIGRIYSNMKNYSQALDYFKRAVQIYRANYVPEYEEIKETQQYIDEIENKLNEIIPSVH